MNREAGQENESARQRARRRKTRSTRGLPSSLKIRPAGKELLDQGSDE